MAHDPNWSDHVGVFLRLQTAVRILAEGQGKVGQRFDKATQALVTLLPRDFPAHIHAC